MQTHRAAGQTLNYFQQSPVRGQLEPPDGYARTGWRYLQCTDTPNELRVLLPPRTALVYSHLLKAEVLELAKDKEAAWDRIIQIRRLKDRMLRKCQRLAKDSSSYDKNTGRTMMFTVHAPPDFRLKEMERWFRDQGPDFVQQVSDTPTSAAPYSCSKCGPLGVQPTLPRKTSTQPVSTATATRSTLTRSNTTSTRSTTPTRSRSISQSKPRSRSAGDSTRIQGRSAGKASQATRVPERVPKRPSNSSSDTAVEHEPESVQKVHRPKEVVIQQPTPSNSRSPSASRSASPPAVRPSRVPDVIRESSTPPPITSPSHTPPYMTPQRSEEDLRSQISARSGASTRSLPPRATIQSPEPLPIPYRPREQTFSPAPEPFFGEEARDLTSTLEPQEPREFDDAFEIPRAASPDDSTLIDVQATDVDAPLQTQNEPPSTGQPLDTIHEQPETTEASHGRPLIRRRSSLKKRDSMSRLSAGSASKSVTWAMDRDWSEQMSKFVKSTNEAEVSAYELGELRAQYQEEIAMMRIVCHDALVAAEQLGLDTDSLQREAVALAEQEQKVIAITDHMERRETDYREKVISVLEETKRVVALCDKKRDQQDAF